MLKWKLFPYWKGADVFILGGGTSVRTFPIYKLAGRRVIGCNDAYTFGGGIVSLLHFGDVKWYRKHSAKLQKLNMPIVHTNTELMQEPLLFFAERAERGWHTNALGWNGNTGCSAINLALCMGARRVFLIGFDMRLGDSGESNWHPNDLDTITEIHYSRYKLGFAACLTDWKTKWPGTEIINLNPDSALEYFPKQTPAEILGE